MHRIAVLGAGYAGLPAVNRIARQTHRDEVELVLVSTRDRFVERPRLHQLATGQPRPDRPLADVLAPGVRLRTSRVDRLVDHALAFADTDTDTAELPYDTLLYAPGSTIDVTSVPGVAEHAHTLAGPESAAAIAAALRADPGARVLVVGGGLTGLELAAEVAESFPRADVTLVTAGTPGGWLSAPARSYVADALDALGVRRVADTRVTGVAAGRLDTGLPFDLCLWAGGFTVPRLAADAGVKVDGRGRVITDATLRSLSDPDVYAIGDAAAIPGPWGGALAMGCRTGGFTGPWAADVVVARLRGLPAPPFRFRYFHECLSLGRRRAIIQFLDRDGGPTERTLRGRVATAYKNVVLDAGHWVSGHPGPVLRPRRRVAS